MGAYDSGAQDWAAFDAALYADRLRVELAGIGRVLSDATAVPHLLERTAPETGETCHPGH